MPIANWILAGDVCLACGARWQRVKQSTHALTNNLQPHFLAKTHIATLETFVSQYRGVLSDHNINTEAMELQDDNPLSSSVVLALEEMRSLYASGGEICIQK